MIKLTWYQKIKLALFGKTFIGNYAQKGWHGSIPFYALKCSIHGLYKTYPMGHMGWLDCPLCLDEWTHETKAEQ